MLRQLKQQQQQQQTLRKTANWENISERYRENHRVILPVMEYEQTRRALVRYFNIFQHRAAADVFFFSISSFFPPLLCTFELDTAGCVVVVSPQTTEAGLLLRRRRHRLLLPFRVMFTYWYVFMQP